MKKLNGLCAKTILLAALAALAAALQPVLAQSEPTIDKTSVQVTTQEHRTSFTNGKEDQSLWSWTPRIEFRVNGPITSGSQLQVEYTLPGGKSWIKVDCDTGEIGPDQWWKVANPPCGNDLPDEQGVTTLGPVDFKISIRNELQGTSKTLFAGKFSVGKVQVGMKTPEFKNNFDYYVEHDWNLPIGYVYQPDPEDYLGEADPADVLFAPVAVSMWFRGDFNAADKITAHLFYKGREVSNTADSAKGSSHQEVHNTTYESTPFVWRRYRFMFTNALLFNKEEPDNHAAAFRVDQNPGEYEVKVMRNGKLVRSAKFTVGADGKLADNGIARGNSLGTRRIVMPVQVLGAEDGEWDKTAWRTTAFYGNPLGGFTAP
jgi:hypothetical protein